MKLGTTYFPSLIAAHAYYSDYGFSPADVDGKLEREEIQLGEPPLKFGEKCYIDPVERRYFIESPV